MDLDNKTMDLFREVTTETRAIEMEADSHIKNLGQRMQFSKDVKLYNLLEAVLMCGVSDECFVTKLKQAIKS